ncbi:MAG: DUF488 domain-containing protein [Chloroherpetonaceae bacterium]
MTTITIYTIGFTNKSAQRFFDLLSAHRVQRLIDTRLNNSSQLAGFAKGKDLAFFAGKICGCEYVHNLLLAPSKEILEDYRNKKITWEQYEQKYLSLLKERAIEKQIDFNKLHQSCFLCSEHLPERCHRRLLVEYIKPFHSGIEIVHLK